MSDKTHNALHYVDLVVRIVVGVSLIPLTFFFLVMGVMAGDAPSSGTNQTNLIFGIGSCIIVLLAISIINLNYFSMLGRARWIVRVPAYLYAPVGLIFGAIIMSDIVRNLIR